MSETAAITALRFTVDGLADQDWVASDKLLDELSSLEPLAFSFARPIRRRHYVQIAFKDRSKPNLACIYLGHCGDGSSFHELFKLGKAGPALVFCEPSNGSERPLNAEAIPVSRLRFIAGLVRVGHDMKLGRPRARKFLADEREELRALEGACLPTPIQPFYGDGSTLAQQIEDDMRERIMAALAKLKPPTVH
jgi:hypothetical protein